MAVAAEAPPALTTISPNFEDSSNKLLGVQNSNTQQTRFNDTNDDLDDNSSFVDCENELKLATETAGRKPIKCSAVHTLERDMPDFDYSHLVQELKAKILEDIEFNPGIYSQTDIDKCRNDEWQCARFLLRHKLDVDAALAMMKSTMRYNHECAYSITPNEIPAEFYKVGCIFTYEPDRKGNLMLYIRAKIHRRIPELNAVMQGFLYYNIRKIDDLAGGKGISIVIDCSGAGIANADMDMVMFLITVLMKYFPKGMSYLLVHELPWILKPFWLLAKAWVPEEHRELIQFSNSRTIYEYVDKEKLPDFMGGTCQRDYRKPPENCCSIKEAAKLWGVEPELVKKTLLKFKDYLPPESLKLLAEFDNDDAGADEDEPKENINSTN